MAIRKGSRDNVTVVVCRFGWASPPTLDAVVSPGPSGSNLMENR